MNNLARAAGGGVRPRTAGGRQGVLRRPRDAGEPVPAAVVVGFAKKGVPAVSLRPGEVHRAAQAGGPDAAGEDRLLVSDQRLPPVHARSAAQLRGVRGEPRARRASRSSPHSAPWRPDYRAGVQAGKAQLFLFGWTRTSSTRPTTSTSTSAARRRSSGSTTRRCSTLLAKADAEPDPDKRTALYQQASVQVMKFLPVIPYVSAAGARIQTATSRASSRARSASTSRSPHSRTRARTRGERSSRRTTIDAPIRRPSADAPRTDPRRALDPRLRLDPGAAGIARRALLGERATPAAVAQIRHQYGLDKPDLRAVLGLPDTTVHGHLGTSIASRRPVTYELRASVPGDSRAGARGHVLRAHARHPARLSGGQEVRISGSTTGASSHRWSESRSRSSSSRSILKYIFAVRLAGFRASAARTCSLTRDAPDELLRSRRDRQRDTGRGLGHDQASDPAGDRARLDPARDRHADHACSRCSTSRTRTTSARLARKGLARASSTATRAPKRAAAGHDDHRPADGPPPVGSRPDRDGVRLPGRGIVVEGRDLQPRLPGDPGRDPLPRDRVRRRQSARRHLLRDHQPPDPAVS